ncbi:cysteine protease family C01A [Thraustotheca clavata]|uniref:Cysteine protease family C01A n=1 Tax=Thraustotheca clavata TaxID=74557 RepID=A0A0A7CLT7_9STRA|nr:secreted protein [Thraustotheca clavata]OQS06723.1 cysteine protease family C01A [Thraustotheca clavata]
MVHPILLTLVVITWAFSPEELLSLMADLEAWHEAFAKSKPASFSDEMLFRMHNAKKVVLYLHKTNPHATFTHMTPYSLTNPTDSDPIVMKAELNSVNLDLKSGLHILSSAIDWSQSSCSLPVLNQGSCNNCWAITAARAVALANCISDGTLYHLSVQQVTSCFNDSSTSGCWGGNEGNAINWINQQGGLCVENDYLPSANDPEKCYTTCQPIPLESGEAVQLSGELALESQLKRQPVAVSVAAANDVWRYYSGGIISSCPEMPSDHSVLAVGFGVQNGVKFFKLQNSWGSTWGEEGYIRVERGVGGNGTCNVAERIVFPRIALPLHQVNELDLMN